MYVGCGEVVKEKKLVVLFDIIVIFLLVM